MSRLFSLCAYLILLFSFSLSAQNKKKTDVFEKANNGINKAANVIAVFQPYLLKAREIFYDAKQLASDARNSAKSTFKKNKNRTDGDMSNGIYANNNSNQTTYYDTSSAINQDNNNYSQSAVNNIQQNNSDPQNYLVNQSLPVNNNASVNNDGTGNWGNQNNGLYGNCLDALTGTVMGMGDASQTPTSVDLMFFAPADGQNTYYIMTPDFARNNGSYMTEHVSDQVQQWADVNETEVALTKLTIGQFDQIQNNSQVTSAVRNAQNYSGYYSSVGQKLDGHVFAIKVQMENREVYALIAVIKQIGTSGSNGYLKIKIKAQGIDNGNGQINTNAYLR
jgi:hypothetical protein